MAVFFSHLLRFPSSPLVAPRPSYHHSRRSRPPSSASSSRMEPQNGGGGGGGRERFMEFPYVSAPYRDLMVDLVSTVETRLDSYLLPSTLPPDVQYFHNETATAKGSLHIRSAIKPSPVDFILGSWIHCELPSGALNIMSLSAYLSPLTDAPNFLIDLIQSSPTSVVIILDLLPRKDLVLHPDYLHAYYEDTQLDRYRQILEKIPEVRPYFSPSLYIRSAISPTAILVRIETDVGRTERMEEIVSDHVNPIAKEVLGTWLDRCICGVSEMGEAERNYLAERDQIIKTKSIEIDLGSSLPRLFGQHVAARVLGAIREVFNTQD